MYLCTYNIQHTYMYVSPQTIAMKLYAYMYICTMFVVLNCIAYFSGTFSCRYPFKMRPKQRSIWTPTRFVRSCATNFHSLSLTLSLSVFGQRASCQCSTRIVEHLWQALPLWLPLLQQWNSPPLSGQTPSFHWDVPGLSRYGVLLQSSIAHYMPLHYQLFSTNVHLW